MSSSNDSVRERWGYAAAATLAVILMCVLVYIAAQPGHPDYGPVLHDSAGHACYQQDLAQDARGFHCLHTVEYYR